MLAKKSNGLKFRVGCGAEQCFCFILGLSLRTCRSKKDFSVPESGSDPWFDILFILKGFVGGHRGVILHFLLGKGTRVESVKDSLGEN